MCFRRGVARNTLLCETWVEPGDALEWQRLPKRRETYGGVQIPIGGLFLTAGVVVQKDRIEVDVWAWGRGLEAWRLG
jgi:phage terminase large subunit GpA-like protein